MSSTVGFYTVKVTAIFLMSVLYFIVGSVLSVLLNDAIPDKDLHMLSTPYLIALLSLIFGSIGVAFYILRNLVKHMPFFLDGYYGFKYSMLREATGGIIIGYVMYAYLEKLAALMRELSSRIYKKA
jgi:hypothetical protein